MVIVILYDFYFFTVLCCGSCSVVIVLVVGVVYDESKGRQCHILSSHLWLILIRMIEKSLLNVSWATEIE